MNEEKIVSIKEKVDDVSKTICNLVIDFLVDNLPAYESLKDNEELRLRYDLILNALITNLIKITYTTCKSNPNFTTDFVCWEYIKKVVDEDFERKLDTASALERLNNPGPKTSLDDMEKEFELTHVSVQEVGDSDDTKIIESTDEIELPQNYYLVCVARKPKLIGHELEQEFFNEVVRTGSAGDAAVQVLYHWNSDRYIAVILNIISISLYDVTRMKSHNIFINE